MKCDALTAKYVFDWWNLYFFSPFKNPLCYCEW